MGRVEVGTEVKVIAEEKAGHDFVGWSAVGIELANLQAVEQSFLMPKNAVTLTAIYVAHIHTLTLDGDAAETAYGTDIELTAEEREGHTFVEWTAVGIELEDKTSSSQAFSMPDNDVTLTRVVLAHPEEKSQSFEMPANNVILTSNYTTDYVVQPMELLLGWNLVTVTETPDEESCETLLGYSPFAYDTVSKDYVMAMDKMTVAGTPLWIYCRVPAVLTLYGKPVDDRWTLTLIPGWNCVGAVNDVPTLPANATAWEWKKNGYVLVDGGLKAGKAYWILVE